VTIAELRHGVERLATGRRRKRLNEWIEGELLFLVELRAIRNRRLRYYIQQSK
jgi:hypothetical protein